MQSKLKIFGINHETQGTLTIFQTARRSEVKFSDLKTKLFSLRMVGKKVGRA